MSIPTPDGAHVYRCTPRQVRKFAIRTLMAGLVPFVQSSPGMGKSAIFRAIAREYNLFLIDLRLSTVAPTDLTGLPTFIEHEDGTKTATFAPFDIFPIAGTELPLWPGETERKYDAEGRCINCYDGWLLFFDEMNSGSKMVQAAAYKVLLDKEVGSHKLHEKCLIAAAGNLATDRAIVNPLSTATQSRVIHFEMVLDHEEFMQDVVFQGGWDLRVSAYLSYMPGKLHDFRPEHQDKTFCCPRTWEFVNKLIKGVDYQVQSDGSYAMDDDAPLFAGAITSGVAVEFIQFTRVFSYLPKIADIVRDPVNTPVPYDPPVRFAAVTYLVEQANDANFGAITKYMNGFTAELRTLFFRSLMAQKPDLRRHTAFRAAVLDISKYLYD